MRRAASHYIWCFGKQHRLHYIEWDENGILTSLSPLKEELAGVAFYNGTMAVIPANEQPAENNSMEDWQRLSMKVRPASPIKIYSIDGENIYSGK